MINTATKPPIVIAKTESPINPSFREKYSIRLQS